MDKARLILRNVYEAKEDNQKADDLIRKYIPFIRAETSKFMGRLCTESDDEFSIAMIAFHEAILGYDRLRGAFLSYAAKLIRSRLIDEYRREQRHQGHLSLDTREEETERSLGETLADPRDAYSEAQNLEATRQEIAELSAQLAGFGVSFADIADHSPKQERSLAACLAAIAYARENPALLQRLLSTRLLPMQALAEGSGSSRKTLERHRKYILAMLLIQTNGYEIIRGHLRHVWKKGGAPV